MKWNTSFRPQWWKSRGTKHRSYFKK